MATPNQDSTTPVVTTQPGSTPTQVVQEMSDSVLQEIWGSPKVQQHEPREWNSALCSCFDDVPSCLLSFFCGICYQCSLSARMGENCCVPCCVQGGLIALRTKIRAENNINGSICGDCCTLSFCTPCGVAQMKREMDYVHGVKET